jgi:hypothetical protein
MKDGLLCNLVCVLLHALHVAHGLAILPFQQGMDIFICAFARVSLLHMTVNRGRYPRR